MNYWATQGYTNQQLADMAYNAHAAGTSFNSLDAQASNLIGWLWGTSAASDELTQAVSAYINAGGNWADVVLAGVHHDNFSAALLDAQGNLSLVQSYHSDELGWSADTSNDALNGGEGNDTLIGGRGSDLLDGGAGIDMAVFSGNLADYVVIRNESSLSIKVGNETDSVSNVERLRFADTKVALDLDGNAGLTMEFIGTLAPNLLSDATVRGVVLGLFDAGETMQSLCQRAIDLHLVPTANMDLATAIYQNVLSTAPTEEMTQTLIDYIASHGQADFLATVAGLHLNVDLVGLQQSGIEYL